METWSLSALRIVVTGAAGFVGSHLCDRLVADGHSVTAVDNLSSGSLRNLEAVLARDSFEFREHDVCRRFELEGPVGAIYNLACPASPRDYLRAPIETLLASALGTRNMLELAREKGAVFVQASTSEAYGDPKVHPQPEEYWGNVNPVGPRSVYDEGKRFAEALTMAYHRRHGVRTKIARLFNVYGPRMRRSDGRVLPAFLDQALRGLPLTVFGDGSQTRSFCFVSDTVDGIVRLAGSDLSDPVNIGAEEEVTVLELAASVQESAGISCGIVHCALPEDDPSRRRPDISRAKSQLGWQPRVALREGITRMLQAYAAAPVETRNPPVPEDC